MSSPVAASDLSSEWDVLSYTYKNVESHPIKASVFLPRSLPEGEHRLILFVHGGYLIGGQRDLNDRFTPWILSHAQTHHAIIVSADYRLLPTPNGADDINEDLEDFWTWVENDLSSSLESRRPGHRADINRILLYGASAGGYCATQLALSHPDRVRTLIAVYPMLDLKSEFWLQGYRGSKKTLGNSPKDSFLTPEETRAELAEYRKRGVISNAGPERRRVTSAAIQWGSFQELFDPKMKRRQICWGERVKTGAKLPSRT